MDSGGAVFGALLLVLVLALVGVYAGARIRKGRPPAHAREAAHTSPDPGGDQDVIPRESGGGMPLVSPAEDPADMSVDEMQQRAGGSAS